MPRTAAQAAADDALEAAILACAKAYDMVEEGWAMGDWIVGVNLDGFSDALAGRARYLYLLPGADGMPWHRILGLWGVINNQLLGAMEDSEEDQDGG